MKALTPGDPKVLGGIELRGRLGHGGMGMAYLGVLADGEPVVVKTILDTYVEDSQAYDRFDREIRAMEMVQGPRVAQLVKAYDPDDLDPDGTIDANDTAGGAGTSPWLAAEYSPGLTLSDYVAERGPLPADLGAALGLGLAEALASIHNAKVLHRDLKPSNVILGKDGPRVIDFGLAALTEIPSDLSYSSQRLGTPLCMAPEQVHSPDVDRRADIYALGAVLVFALTGHYPYERPGGGAAIQAAVASASVVPNLSGLPAAMTGPVTAMLAHAAAARPELDQITEELTKVITDAGHADPASALAALAGHTYIERDTDPRPAAPSRPRPSRARKDPHVPSPLVRGIADRLRNAYAGAAAF